MSIKVSNVTKNLVLVFLICKELKLDFEKMQSLFLVSEKVFWKYLMEFLPALRMNSNKFHKLNNLATDFYKLYKGNQEITLLENDLLLYNEVLYRIKDKFICSDDLYSKEDIIEYLNNLGDKPFKVTLSDGSLELCKGMKSFDSLYDYIESMIINSKEFIKTSEYKYNLTHKEEINE